MRRRLLTAGVVLAVAGVAAASAAALGTRDGEPSEGKSALPPATAEVVRQTLRDTQDETGTLGHGDDVNVASGLAGTLTSLAKSGSTVGRGETLYRVDDDPVVLLYGGLPAYRVLSSGSSGRDVLQFEKNLWALGYRGFTVDKEYTYATAAAVEEWQDDLGVTETGTLDPARVHYADGASRVHSRIADKGDAVQPGTDVLALTGQERAVTVSLSVDDQRLAKKGAKVALTLPDDKTTTGKITEVETVVAAAEDDRSDPETEIEVTIALDEPKDAGSLNEASVTVSFTSETRKDVLAVPVAALLSLAEGGYGVEVVEGGASRIIAVETGMFAGGLVEVSSADLAEGDVVGVPE
ncbi:multidrug efflux pump subunit AcrA (membrane-fusion protein) [Actinocorallia herbida]|uniref:Multidrug efflux pump subunit AcrA (Membrane-fusion protein) n=1 Tax=Actinocorallia herbida TaxID=58109 RepID=A0A3N1DB71_9ACTN|nr:peptidoglycan-binding protein [Actinocorallia herbida]ROO90777.1 multidrug efflux pump subunit AcrA (membrane-fusion protein) [Actinocorallia herbida]